MCNEIRIFLLNGASWGQQAQSSSKEFFAHDVSHFFFLIFFLFFFSFFSAGNREIKTQDAPSLKTLSTTNSITKGCFFGDALYYYLIVHQLVRVYFDYNIICTIIFIFPKTKGLKENWPIIQWAWAMTNRIHQPRNRKHIHFSHAQYIPKKRSETNNM